jgi:hypothetical protein
MFWRRSFSRPVRARTGSRVLLQHVLREWDALTARVNLELVRVLGSTLPAATELPLRAAT